MAFLSSQLTKKQPTSEISYELEKRRVLQQYQTGVLSTYDVCDAHPELLRAAHNYSFKQSGDCPICSEITLVTVSYVFGPRLPSHGRCVNSKKDLDRIRKRKGSFTCYEVEVCTSCSWNYLTRAYPL